MARSVLNAILLVALPVAVLLSGAWTMDTLVGRQYVTHLLGEKVAAEDRKPLNERIIGYDSAAVARHWGALDHNALLIENRFLEFDLVFPFLYGAALAGALLLAWVALGRPFHPLWFISPVVITALADWTENIVQLSQLQRYVEKGKSGLEAPWVQTASIATVLKLVFFSGASLLLVCLVVWMVLRAGRRRWF